MISQLLEPSRNILVRLMLADVIDQERSHGASIVGRGYGSITLLTGRIPDLRFDCLCVYLNRASRKLDANSGFGIQVELITSETTQEI